MPAHICCHCAMHYPVSEAPPALCVLCEDARFARAGAEPEWTTPAALRRTHFSAFRRLEPGLMGIGVQPGFAQRRRALLIRTPHGNLLWDCSPLIDDATVAIVTALGGVSAIAVSDPGGHGGMVEWSHALGTPPIHVHAADRKFVPRLDAAIAFWEGDVMELLPGITLIRCGGQFDGGSVLHWAQGGGGGGALLAGDTLRVMPDGGIGFMRSHVNAIPLDAGTVLRIGDRLGRVPFGVLYGGGWDQVIPAGAQAAVMRAIRRHVEAIGSETSL